jgi:hypothetical protein
MVSRTLNNSNKEIIVTGGIFKTARLLEEWLEDLEDPESLIKDLMRSKPKIDIFNFWQRVPDTIPKYKYYMEWDNVAALQIKSFDHWWQKQIDSKVRNSIRNSQKVGVEVKIVAFDDDFVESVRKIYDETPIRQGKPFWHYNKGFNYIKNELSDNLNRAEFIAAYNKNELIGFIKLLYTEHYAMTVLILSMIKHRDKSPTNLMLSKAVELCDKKKIPYLVYDKYDYGKKGSDTLRDFKRHNGFERFNLPRYYVPLTLKGKIILKLNLHRGLIEMFPEKIIGFLLDLRKKWYLRKYSSA